jgi:hypothetical protein
MYWIAAMSYIISDCGKLSGCVSSGTGTSGAPT